MTYKLHTKPALHTVFYFLTNINSIGVYSMLVTLFAFSTITIGMTPAQAELIDLSNPEPVIQLSTRDASWLRSPRFENIPAYLNRYLIRCSYDQDGNVVKPCDKTDLEMAFLLQVDKQGSIKNITVIKSSGIKQVDAAFTREIKRASFKPFLIKGRAVKGNVTLPIAFAAP
ncbi:energy transducer TonB [Psychrobacter piscatorii]|uniref:energy transducer TonB n=1 Tax=Psychrobacter piscatorii TaxID=554343 RepID=UPI00191929C8|nr:energy transducer TonB [Psychrobacter piscatorii]